MSRITQAEVAGNKDIHAREVVSGRGHEIQSGWGVIGSRADHFFVTRIDGADSDALRHFGSRRTPTIHEATVHVQRVPRRDKISDLLKLTEPTSSLGREGGF